MNEPHSFSVTVASHPERPRRILKQGDTFAVLDSHGDMGFGTAQDNGVIHRDTRLLSYYALTIDGHAPLYLASHIDDGNLSLTVQLTNADIFRDGELKVPKDQLHISRRLVLDDGRMKERIRLRNFGSETVRVNVGLTFENDFADLFEIRGMKRAARGQRAHAIIEADRVALPYTGLDAVERVTQIAFHPEPTRIKASHATFEIDLEPGSSSTVFVAVSCRAEPVSPSRSFFEALTAGIRRRRKKVSGVATIETSNAVVNEILCRAMGDLYMLVTETKDGLYPYAGIPWYSTTFGRDGIITALQTLWMDPRIAAGVLQRLARLQAFATDPAADAQPGKILHETRDGEMAALAEVPFGKYYGSVDATPLFIMLADAYAERTGDMRLITSLWPSICSALDWLANYGDPDGDGLYEYHRQSEDGLVNQGWKDSHDSVFHADGSMAKGPIALIEVQAYVWAAKKGASRLARKLGYTTRADRLLDEANRLQRLVEETFWCDELGAYGLALDGEKKLCRVLTTNCGHGLFVGMLDPKRARTTARALLGRRVNSGWGFRTVAEGSSRYNPMSYHNGSVWPHDSAIVACGLARYGLLKECGDTLENLCRVATHFDQRRLPELFCGFRRRTNSAPTLYPVACSPQAWASGSLFQILSSVLGMRFQTERSRIELRNPHVPAFLGEVIVRNVRLGSASADFALRQDPQGGVSLRVLKTVGQIDVSLVFDPD